MNRIDSEDMTMSTVNNAQATEIALDIAFGDLSLAAVLDDLNDGFYVTDLRRIITYWNKGAERISGFTASEVVGRSCSDNILTHVDGDGECLCVGLCPLAKTIEDAVRRENEVFMHHKDGHRIPVLVRTSPLRDKAGVVVGGIELFTDLSNLLTNNLRIQELERLALLDNLTQLANRRYLEREIDVRFKEMERHGIPFAVLFIDIDHFKMINDTYGHDAGDMVLRFMANTLVANSRPFDLFGRWGGEEFIGVIRNVDPEGLTGLGNRMRVLIGHSYVVHGNAKLSVNVSMGATMAQPGDTLDTLIKRADDLLYTSKKLGRNRVTFG